ncbi:caspase-3-like [Dendronephthya gigantea]|nr:caspase-3-like [Dendronephthya gigantea]
MLCSNDVFEYPEWQDSEIEFAIAKVLNEIKQKVYDISSSNLRNIEEDTEKQAFLTGFHQKFFAHLCQLCSLGICQNIESGPSQCYPLERPRGFALIINVKSFSGTTENGVALQERKGSDIDAKRLKELWEKLGFIVEYDAISRKAHEISTILQDMVKNIDRQENSKCFVCCIMTHGDMGRIYGSDSKHLDIKDIIDMFKEVKCKALAGKPKIFFIQACRGSRVLSNRFLPETTASKKPSINDDTTFGSDLSDTATSTASRGCEIMGSRSTTIPKKVQSLAIDDGNYKAIDEGDSPLHYIDYEDDQFRKFADPNEPHFLLGYSTAQGHVSFRSTHEGTWYISALVEVFSKYHQFEDVLSMMSEVTNIVSKKYTECYQKQCPAPISTLVKKVYL